MKVKRRLKVLKVKKDTARKVALSLKIMGKKYRLIHTHTHTHTHAHVRTHMHARTHSCK